MRDTPPQVEKLYRKMLMRRSSAERLRMGAAMFEAAKRLVRAGLGDPDGRDDSTKMRVKLFLRIYGPDFDAASRDRIVAWLRRGEPEGAGEVRGQRVDEAARRALTPKGA